MKEEEKGAGTGHEEFRVRDYAKDDYADVAGLWQLTGLSNQSRGDTEAVINETLVSGGKLLILEELMLGKICGTCWMTCDGRRIHLHHFGIHPDYQGRKLSWLLLKESFRFIKQKGYQVKLEVNRNNIKAINLYKKAGFNYLGDYDVYIIRDLSVIDNNDNMDMK
ncbi:MAG TPA: N-acetyltransferase [Bacteroidales bacterium]|nr:N-acetyltransferase [Bacteroidales bacterium]